MKTSINIHNKTMTNPRPSAQAKRCNCISKFKCPLNNKCFSSNVLYKEIQNRRQRIIKINLTTASVKASLSHDTQTTENLLKTKNAKRHRTFD